MTSATKTTKHAGRNGHAGNGVQGDASEWREVIPGFDATEPRKIVQALDPLRQTQRAAPALVACELTLDQIEPSTHNPRGEPSEESLAELAASIASQGVIEPIVVRRRRDGRYELICGERRWRAARLAGLPTIPAVIRDVDERGAYLLQLVENLQREDLDPIAEARGFARACKPIDRGGAGITQAELGKQLGKSQAYVSNAIRLLELPEPWLGRVISREISPSHGKLLLPFKKDAQVLEEVETRCSEWDGMGKPRTFAAPSLAEFGDAVRHSAARVLVSLSDDVYVGGKHVRFEVALDDATRKQLDVVEIAGEGDGKPRLYARNKKLAIKLVAAARDRLIDAEKKEGKKEGKPTAKNAKGENTSPTRKQEAEPTPAERRAREKERGEQLAKRVAKWKLRWLRDLAALELPLAARKKEGEGIVAKVALWMLAQPVQRYVQDALGACEQATVAAKGHRVRPTAWCTIAAAAPQAALAKALAAGIATIDGNRFSGESEGGRRELTAFLDGLCADLGIDLASAWLGAGGAAARRGFLELHDKDQLAAQAKEWKAAIDTEQTKSQILNNLTAPEKNFPLPKCLRGDK
jgi:ParB/RepB/Spo0J family partition protein